MAEIQTQDLTEATLAGQGVFDELMRASKAHLEQEYTKGRIKGPEYSQVYLGSLQATMQYAIQFLLERQRADQQAELLKAQVVTEQKQQALLEQQTVNAVTENEVLQKQICKLEAEFDVLMEQKLKTIAETALLTQKKATELAQTSGINVDDHSVIGRQMTLYKAQADGFKRDAEQKAAKVLVDTWNVRRTTDEGTVADDLNKLSDAHVGRAINTLLSGIQA